MSSRISELSQQVTNVGRQIQRDTDDQSRLVEDLGREVDADESIPFPAKSAIEDMDDEEDDGENGEPLEPSFPQPSFPQLEE